MDEFIPKEETRKNSMDEFISKERKRKYQGIPKKVTEKHSHLCAAEAATLLPPRRTRSSLNDARLLPRRSYDIYFCVPFRADGEELKLHKKESHETAWAYWRWYNVNIHPDGPGKGNQKQLLPFWKGKLPLFGGIAALHSRIYFFGGVTCGSGFIRDVYKLDLDADSKAWVPVSPMVSRRFEPSASVLGGKIYVRNYQPFDHSGDLWCEAFDPVNDKWKPFPSPPIYPGSSSIVLSEALENPDRILVAYRAPDDASAAIFYAYNLQHRSWQMLAPSKRKLHPMWDDEWVGRAVTVGNTLYWIQRVDDIILLIAYDLDLDQWLEGRLKRLTNYDFESYRRQGCACLPAFLHLEKQRFCLLQCTLDDSLHCVIADVSRMPDGKTLGIAVAWEHKYALEPRVNVGLPDVIAYCVMV